MDLFAYTQIDELKYLLEELNVDIPRLRGLRMMKKENKISEEEINETINSEIVDMVYRWLTQHDWYSSCSWKNYHPALIKDKDHNVIDYDMKKIHGKDRKIIKLNIKRVTKNVRHNLEMFNQYVEKDVLYVHARIGGWNRSYYNIRDLQNHPKYLNDCDDCYDNTYCNIYFDIKDCKN